VEELDSMIQFFAVKTTFLFIVFSSTIGNINSAVGLERRGGQGGNYN